MFAGSNHPRLDKIIMGIVDGWVWFFFFATDRSMARVSHQREMIH